MSEPVIVAQWELNRRESVRVEIPRRVEAPTVEQFF
jgi:hypothetical protein